VKEDNKNSEKVDEIHFRNFKKFRAEERKKKRSEKKRLENRK